MGLPLFHPVSLRELKKSPNVGHFSIPSLPGKKGGWRKFFCEASHKGVLDETGVS